MKNINYIMTITCVALLLSMQSCKKWNEVESLNGNKIDLDKTTKTDEYYESLREWKKTTGMPQIFVWFDNWNGLSPTGEFSLSGLPDSVTIASNWGGHPKFDLSAERRADMEHVQKVKGTKVVVTLFSAAVGDDMPANPIYNIGNSSDPAVVRPAIRHYAEAIYDAVIAAGYDGFDWDYEPQGGGIGGSYLWSNKVQRTIFVEELGYYFGKGSQRTDRDNRKPAKPGLLYLIDGEIGIRGRMDKDWASQYVDYFVLQAYNSTTVANQTSRVFGVITDMSDHIAAGRITPEEVVARTILTENFESYANTGGGFLSMSKFIYNSNGVNQQIGGVGLYRSGFDFIGKATNGSYNGSAEYFFLRKGITNLYTIYNQRKGN